MQWVFSNVERNIDLVLQTTVQTAQQCTTTCQPDTILHNICIQFGRCILQSGEYGILYLSNGFVQTVGNFLIAYGNLHRQGRDTVWTMNNVVLGSLIAQVCQGRADSNLDTLSHTLRYLHVVLTGHILLNISGEVVTSGTDRVITYDTTQRNHSNLCATTTDIYNHVTLWSIYIDTNTDSSSHRLKNQVNVTSVSMLSTVAYSTKLHLG